MLDIFGMAKGGKEYRRLVAAFERIFGATIFFGTESMRSTARVVHRSRFNFLREAQIWYNRELNEPPEGEHFENVITLSDEFYNEIKGHPIPSDLEAIKLLAGAPAVLDLFMWLTYRCFTSKGPEAVPIFGPYGLVAQLGSVEYSRPKRFRAELEKWLKTIRTLWPCCPAHLDRTGLSLLLAQSAAITPRSSPLSLSDVGDHPALDIGGASRAGHLQYP
jgi:hypothetical protein